MKRITILMAWVCSLTFLVQAVDAQVRRAENARKKQQYQEALGLIEQALEEEPDNVRALETRARIYQDSAAAASGEAYLTAMRLMKADLEHVATLDEKRTEDVAQQLLLSYVGEFRKGIDAFNSAQTAADDAERAGFFQNAADFFQGSTIVAPDSVGSYVNWAFARLGAGDDLGAIEPLTLALEYGPPDIDVYNYLSRIYLSHDRSEEAMPVLEEAVSHFPDDSELQGFLLNAYTASGETDRAIEQYSTAVADSPDNNLYRYNYGSLLLQVERFDEAIAQLIEVVQRDPDYTDAQYNLGAAYVNKAIALNTRISGMDDDLRAERDSLSDEEIDAREAAMDTLALERRDLFGLAIAPLEAAKSLAETEGDRSTAEICRVLYQSYVQTNQMEKVETVAECAGM